MNKKIFTFEAFLNECGKGDKLDKCKDEKCEECGCKECTCGDDDDDDDDKKD